MVCVVDGVFPCATVVYLPGGESLDEWREIGEESTEDGPVESGCLFIEKVVSRSPRDLKLNE